MSRSTRRTFGFRRHAAQAELESCWPGVHAGALGQAGVFGMLDDAEADAGCSGEGLAHHAIFEDGVAVVGDGDGAGGFERGEVVECFAFGTAGGCGDGEDADARAAFGGEHPAGDFGRVVDGNGVGHGRDGGESACGCCGGAGGDGFFVALAGLAEMDVNVDEAGCDDEAGGVEDFSTVGELEFAGAGDFGDAAVFEQDVFGSVDAGAGIDEVAVANDESRHARPSSFFAAVQRAFDDGHADGYAVADLLEDGGLRAVGDAGGELQAANDGAGMHDDGFWCLCGEALAGELVGVFVLREVELQSGEALGLDAQHHDDLRLAQGGFEVAFDGDSRAGVGGGVGQQLRRSAEDDARAEARQQQHVRAGDAAVEDVADDGDGDAAEGIGG